MRGRPRGHDPKPGRQEGIGWIGRHVLNFSAPFEVPNPVVLQFLESVVMEVEFHAPDAGVELRLE